MRCSDSGDEREIWWSVLLIEDFTFLFFNASKIIDIYLKNHVLLLINYIIIILTYRVQNIC